MTRNEHLLLLIANADIPRLPAYDGWSVSPTLLKSIVIVLAAHENVLISNRAIADRAGCGITRANIGLNQLIKYGVVVMHGKRGGNARRTYQISAERLREVQVSSPLWSAGGGRSLFHPPTERPAGIDPRVLLIGTKLGWPRETITAAMGPSRSKSLRLVRCQIIKALRDRHRCTWHEIGWLFNRHLNRCRVLYRQYVKQEAAKRAGRAA